MKGNPELPFSASLQGVAIQSRQFSDLSHICCFLQKVDTLDVFHSNFRPPSSATLQMIQVTFFKLLSRKNNFHGVPLDVQSFIHPQGEWYYDNVGLAYCQVIYSPLG